MKNKICFCLLFTVLFLCGCTENTNITVSSENKVYETVSTEETVSLVTEKKQQQLQRKLIPPSVTDLVQKKLHVILFSFAKTKMKFMLTTVPY